MRQVGTVPKAAQRFYAGGDLDLLQRGAACECIDDLRDGIRDHAVFAADQGDLLRLADHAVILAVIPGVVLGHGDRLQPGAIRKRGLAEGGDVFGNGEFLQLGQMRNSAVIHFEN